MPTINCVAMKREYPSRRPWPGEKSATSKWLDIAGAADFYQSVFGWNTRKLGDGSIDDGANEVSVPFVPGRPPSSRSTCWCTSW